MRCWELVHKFKHFSEIKTAKIIIIILFFGCCNFTIFFDIIETFFIRFNLEKVTKDAKGKYSSQEKNY